MEKQWGNSDTMEPVMDWYIDKLVRAKGRAYILPPQKNGAEYHIDPTQLTSQ